MPDWGWLLCAFTAFTAVHFTRGYWSGLKSGMERIRKEWRDGPMSLPLGRDGQLVVTFWRMRNRRFSPRNRWHVTCSCGGKSGRLREDAAKGWVSDHMALHGKRADDA